MKLATAYSQRSISKDWSLVYTENGKILAKFLQSAAYLIIPAVTGSDLSIVPDELYNKKNQWLEGKALDFVFAAAIFGIFVLISLLIDRGKRDEKVRKRLKEQWGKLPDNSPDDFDFRRISTFFREYAKKNARYIIDDTTWNDLDMDRFYTMINSTSSSIGDEVLYSLLRTPLYDAESMEDRLRLIRYWDENPEAREKVQLCLSRFGKYRDKGASMLMGDAGHLEPRKGNWFKLFTFLPVLTLPVITVNVGFGMLLLILSIGFNVLYHEKVIKEIDSKISIVTSAVSIIALADRIAKLDIPAIPGVSSRLNELLGSLREVARKGSPSLFINKEVIDDPTTVPKMVFLIDIWSYQASVLLLKQKIGDFARLFELIGLLDATICLASYRKTLDGWCVPDIRWDHDDGMPGIDASNVRHPMVKNCVGNPVLLKNPVLVTGSNASGKSTYLKTVAINTLLAHTAGTCLAENWTSVPLFPITSMALRDSIVDGESYFIAEIKSIKRIFSAVNPQIKLLCVVDEVLRGTNTMERIAASSRVLYSLARENVCLIAATHDLELADILEGVFENRHFEETVTDSEVSFDYRIREGRAATRNAIRLLKVMGFDPGIVSDCMDAVARFEATRHWDRIKEG